MTLVQHFFAVMAAVLGVYLVVFRGNRGRTGGSHSLSILEICNPYVRGSEFAAYSSSNVSPQPATTGYHLKLACRLQPVVCHIAPILPDCSVFRRAICWLARLWLELCGCLFNLKRLKKASYRSWLTFFHPTYTYQWPTRATTEVWVALVFL